MKIRGNIDEVKNSIDYYGMITSTRDLYSKEDFLHEKVRGLELSGKVYRQLQPTFQMLKGYFFNSFLSDYKEELKCVIDEKVANGDFKEETQEVQEEYIESVSEELFTDDSDDTGVVESFSPNAFLQLVSNNVKVETNAEYVSNGIYIDEITNLETDKEDLITEDKYTEEIQESGYEDDRVFEDHGIFIDDIEVSVTEVITEDIEVGVKEEIITTQTDKDYAEHGVFLEDVIIEYSEEESEVQSEDYEFEEEDSYETYEEPVVEVESEQEEEFEFTDEEDDFIEGEVPEEVSQPINLEVSKKDEPEKIYIPPNVRDYVKSHKDCTELELRKYYSKKDIQKALNTSKIYKKGGKYYV